MTQAQISTPPSRSRIARSLAVAFGPSLLLDLFATVSTAAAAVYLASGGRKRPPLLLRPIAILGAALPWLYFLVIRPWHRRWGATDEEAGMWVTGDEVVPNPAYDHTRAVTIHAPVDVVWQWLAQIGEGRGGFYSYDWLERLAGCDVHSADYVHPEWQDVKPGQTLPLLGGWGPKIATVRPGRDLVIEGWGTYSIRSVDANTTRLLARARHPGGWPLVGYAMFVEIPHFIMERKLLLGLKARAERAAQARAPIVQSHV